MLNQNTQFKSVLLVDGSNLLWRSVFGFGEQNCARGVVSYLNTLFDVIQPSSCIIFWDVSSSRKRVEIYPEYKAGRQKARTELDRDLIMAQQHALQRYLRLQGIQEVVVGGVEADDTIAIVADYLAGTGSQVVVATSDVDLWQLISDKVSVYDHVREKYILESDIEKKFGVPDPSLIPYYKALVGDSSDNIKGVKGLGAKIVSTLFKEYASISKMREPEVVKALSKSKRTVKLYNFEDEFERDLLLTRLPTLVSAPMWLNSEELQAFKEVLKLKEAVPDPVAANVQLDYIQASVALPKPLTYVDLGTMFQRTILPELAPWGALDKELDRQSRLSGVLTNYGKGYTTSEIMLVCSGHSGTTFLDEENTLVHEMLKECGVDASEVFITSAHKFCAEDRCVPSLSELAESLPFLQAEVDLLKPKLIIVFGNAAMSLFTHYDNFVTKHCGELSCFAGTHINHTARVLVNVDLGAALRSGKHLAHFKYAVQQLSEFLIKRLSRESRESREDEDNKAVE